jgi:hypothetical protein
MHEVLAGAGLELLTLAAPFVIGAWLCNLAYRVITVNLQSVMVIALLSFVAGVLTVTLIARLKFERNKTS